MGNKRRFSLEDDFMKTRTNTILYGFMRCISTAKPGSSNWKEYLLKSTFKKNINIITKLCGVTKRTITRNLKSLIECGLVKEGITNEQECYYFPYDYNGIYKLIDKDLLKFIVSTNNAFGIQIYLYLLNCSTKKKDYEFTLKELNEAFGYTETNSVSKGIIKSCLISLKNDGIIDYEDKLVQFHRDNGNIQQTTHKILKFVATQATKKITDF